MAEFLLVVERLMADGADAAMMVDESTYRGAMFACVFAEPVHGYVWCDRHGWVRSDEACVCDDCVWEALQTQAEAEAQLAAEFPCGEFDDGAHWRRPAQVLSSLSPGQWACEPCGDPEWTEEALAADVAHMAEVEERAWLQTERAAEQAVQQFVSQRPRTDPPRPRETVEQQVRRAVFDMAKGKDVSRILR
jgi:hypothetical protein